jgi:protein arginine N-methyltransferase 1
MLERPIRFVIQRLKCAIKSNKLLRNLFYDIGNQETFTDLYIHERMLADHVRMETYYKGIGRYVHEGDLVLDLGTGSGILSFLAAQRKPRRIYAVDHSPFLEVARKVAEYNRMDNIQFIGSNSRNFKPAEKMDVIIHEQLGNDLFNENMVENLLDLKRRVLKNTGKIIPGKFELFLEPVCLRKGYRIPFIWENEIYGIDYKFLRDAQELKKYKPGKYWSGSIDRNAIDHFLSEPKPILCFDLNELEKPDDLPAHIDVSKIVSEAGPFDGLCLYFRLMFDEEIGFDTSPFDWKAKSVPKAISSLTNWTSKT